MGKLISPSCQSQRMLDSFDIPVVNDHIVLRDPQLMRISTVCGHRGAPQYPHPVAKAVTKSCQQHNTNVAASTNAHGSFPKGWECWSACSMTTSMICILNHALEGKIFGEALPYTSQKSNFPKLIFLIP